MQEILLMILVIVTGTISQVCDYGNSVELINRSYNGIQYNDGEYFVDNATGTERGCVCLKKNCIRKCCPLGQGYDPDIRKCVEILEQFDPPVWEGSEKKIGFQALTDFHLLFHKMNCSKANNEKRIRALDVGDDFHLKTDGKLFVYGESDQLRIEYNTDKYCIDNFVVEDAETKNSTIEMNGLICFIETIQNNHYGVSASCMLVSCFFILLTVAVYAILPRLRNLNGMVMVTYLMNLFVGFLLLATMQILLMLRNISSNTCIILTFMIYFTILAAFFWLNVMCYDLWSKLRSSKNMAHGFASSMRIRYLMYSAYAFGIPTVLTILLGILEFSHLPAHKLLPQIRTQACFLYGTSKLLYLYTPILFVCVANLIFFIMTAKILAQMKKQTQAVLKNKDSQRFSLYIKLFIVTGINWVLEVISALFPEADNFWQFTDAYNVLVGLIIFLIFVCKKKTLKSFWRRCQKLMGKEVSQAENTNTRISAATLSQSVGDLQTKTNVLTEPN